MTPALALTQSLPARLPARLQRPAGSRARRMVPAQPRCAMHPDFMQRALHATSFLNRSLLIGAALGGSLGLLETRQHNLPLRSRQALQLISRRALMYSYPNCLVGSATAGFIMAGVPNAALLGLTVGGGLYMLLQMRMHNRR